MARRSAFDFIPMLHLTGANETSGSNPILCSVRKERRSALDVIGL